MVRNMFRKCLSSFHMFSGTMRSFVSFLFRRLWTFKGLSILFTLVIQLSFVALVPTEHTTIEMRINFDAPEVGNCLRAENLLDTVQQPRSCGLVAALASFLV